MVKTFTSRLCDELKSSEYSQIEIANILKIDPTNLTNWKKGKNFPSVQLLSDLCKLLDISSDYLLGLSDNSGNVFISPEERKLLDTFRKLNTKNRLHVSTYAEIRLEEQGDGAGGRRA